MRLILIRHAQSKHAQAGVVAGPRGCPGLTPLGLEQAQRLASHLQAAGRLQDCSVLLASPALRARQTAEALLPVLPVSAIQIDEHLYEQLPGAADGLTYAEYEAQYGKFNAQEQPDRPFSPGGESWNQFIQRVRTTPQRLAEQFPDQTVAAVTHAGFIVVSFLALFEVPLYGPHARIDPDFTGITEWEMMSGSGCRLIRYNETSHL